MQNKIDNFCRLEPTICRLGIKGFDSLMALQIMNGERKKCIDLLYKIKMALSAIKTSVGRHPASNIMPGKFEALNNFIRLPRPSYDKQKSSIFRKSISIRLKSQNQVDMEKHLKPFYDEKRRQQDYVEDMKRKDRENQEMYVQEIRARRAMTKRAELDYLNEWNEKGIGIWIENQRRRKYVNDVYNRYAISTRERKLAKAERELHETCQDTQDGILGVENRVHEYETHFKQPTPSVENAPNQIESKGVDDEEEVKFLMSKDDSPFLPSMAKTSKEQELARTRSNIPSYDPSEVRTFIEDLRARKGSEAATQGERERRRVRFVVGLKENTAKELNGRLVRGLQQSISSPCAEETKLEEQMLQLQTYGKVVAENRAFREEQVKAQAEREKEIEARRKNALEQAAKKRAEQDQSWLHHHIERLGASRRAAKAHQTEESCREIVEGIIQLSLSQMDHIIGAGGPQFSLAQVLGENAAAFSTQKDVESVELSDYLAFERLWPLAKEDSINAADANNLGVAVGSYLMQARSIAFPPPEPAGPRNPELERFNIQAAVLGAPLAGKSTAVWRLAARFNLVSITPTNSLERLFEQSPEKKPASNQVSDELCVEAILLSIRKAMELRARQAERVQELQDQGLLSGENASIEDVLFTLWDADGSGDIDPQELLRAALVANCEGKSKEQVESESISALRQMDFDLNGRITREEFHDYFHAVFGDQKNQVLGDLLRHTDQLCKPIEGWVLDNFPRTRNQARLLELALSGLNVDQSKYQPDAAATLPCLEPTLIDRSEFKGLGKGAFDVVVDLSIPDEVVCARAAELGLTGTDRFRIGPGIMHYANNIAQVQDWYDAFGVIHQVDAQEKSQDDVFAAVRAPLQAIVEQKQALEEQRQAAHARRQYESRCDRICEIWSAEIAEAQQAVHAKFEPEDAQDESNQATSEPSVEELAALSVIPIPHLCPHSIRAAGVCAEVRDKPTEDGPSCWFADNLVVSPEEAVNLASQYRKSAPGVALGLANNLLTQLSGREIDFDVSHFSQAIINGLQLPENEEEAQDKAGEDEESEQKEESQDGQISTEIQFANFLESQCDKLARFKAKQAEEQAEEQGEEQAAQEKVEEKHEETKTEETAVDASSSSALADFQPIIDLIQAASLELFTAKRKEQEELEKKNKKAGGKDKKAQEDQEQDESTEDSPKTALDRETAQRVIEQIDANANGFVTDIKTILSNIRALQQEWLDHHAVERANFDCVLREQATDLTKAEKVDEFQAQFDQVEEELRYHPKTKQELHQQLKELVLSLSEIMQERKESTQDKIKSIIESPWLGNFKDLLTDQHLKMVQCEVNRFQGIRGSLVLLGNQHANGSCTFTTPEQAQMYQTLWPIASCFGDSLDPAISFPGKPEEKTSAKGKGKDKDEAETLQDPSVCVPDPRVAVAQQSAESLVVKLQAVDNPAVAEDEPLSKALHALDELFKFSVARILRKCDSKCSEYHTIANSYWDQLKSRCNERFDAEWLAVEAMAVHVSKHIEDALPLAKHKLSLEGPCFKLHKQ